MLETQVELSAAVTVDSRAHAFPPRLWFRYPAALAAQVHPRADAFHAALLQTAMALGEDLHTRGPLSPRLWYAAEDYQALFRTWRPAVFPRPIRVTAEDLAELPPVACAGRKVLAFSGGLDAYFTLHHLLKEEADHPGETVLDAGLTILGLRRTRLEDQPRYQRQLAQHQAVLSALGKQWIAAETNILDFFPPGLDLLMWIATSLNSTVMGLGGLFGTLYMAAGTDYSRLVPAGASPLVNNLLRTERLEVYTHGMPYSRLEKLRLLQDWPVLHDNLVVCFDHLRPDYTVNCGVCPKCLRTRAAMEVLGITGRIRTFPAQFSLRDVLRWGRWLEIGHGWEGHLLAYARAHNRRVLPRLRLGIVIGVVRRVLKTLTPPFLRRLAYRLSAPRYFR
jgi:hypothetical protein